MIDYLNLIFSNSYIVVGLFILFIAFCVYKSKQLDKLDKENKEVKKENEQLKSDVVDEEELQEAEEKREKYPYVLSPALLSPKEKSFYNSLKPITDELGLVILCKMRLADIIQVPKDTYDSIRWFNYIKAKHIDFVICDRNFKLVKLVEVDDRTHQYENRIKRDEFVNKIFEQLNITLLHYYQWNAEQLKKDFAPKENIQ